MIIAGYSTNVMCEMRCVLVIIRMRRAEKTVMEESLEGPLGCGVDNL
mgnify:CR=1 FL=1